VAACLTLEAVARLHRVPRGGSVGAVGATIMHGILPARAMNRRATATWEGSLKDGKGRFTVESGRIGETPYSWAQRFGEEKGTNPEELIAAAHASCFAMASSSELGKIGITPQRIEAKATVTMEKAEAGFSITRSHLDVTVRAPGADRAKVQQALEAAKKGCPVSRLLAPGLTISMAANVEV
jgi:osmotically inducible protein OsmC